MIEQIATHGVVNDVGPVGGPLFDQCLRSVAWNGRILVVGFVGGDIPKAPINLILLKGCQVVGVFYGAFTGRERAADAENWRELNALWASGAIRPKISAHYPLAEGGKALRALMDREGIGKVVVEL